MLSCLYTKLEVATLLLGMVFPRSNYVPQFMLSYLYTKLATYILVQLYMCTQM